MLPQVLCIRLTPCHLPFPSCFTSRSLRSYQDLSQHWQRIRVAQRRRKLHHPLGPVVLPTTSPRPAPLLWRALASAPCTTPSPLHRRCRSHRPTVATLQRRRLHSTSRRRVRRRGRRPLHCSTRWPANCRASPWLGRWRAEAHAASPATAAVAALSQPPTSVIELASSHLRPRTPRVPATLAAAQKQVPHREQLACSRQF
mmetsp:Transcript_61813/g.201684  ORF Transcript_61813/g.201684 Transcript_61813/m.201684 type:complete len:200 (+) Transcript_61813:98-697(+)